MTHKTQTTAIMVAMMAALLLAGDAMAQTSGGVITSPPGTLTSANNGSTDSTLPVQQLSATTSNSVIQFAQPQANPSNPVGGVVTNPIQTCFAGTAGASRTASCPAGYTTSGGSSTFTQTQTTTTTCPLGPYGAATQSVGPWSPGSDTGTCPTLIPVGVPSSAPTGVVAMENYQSGTNPFTFTASWNPVSGATYYQVTYQPGSGAAVAKPNGTAWASGYTAVPFANPFTVQGCNASGCGPSVSVNYTVNCIVQTNPQAQAPYQSCPH